MKTCEKCGDPQGFQRQILTLSDHRVKAGVGPLATKLRIAYICDTCWSPNRG